jgi:hypothetical protein
MQKLLGFLGLIPRFPASEEADEDKYAFQRRKRVLDIRLQRLTREVEAQIQSDVPEDHAAW